MFGEKDSLCQRVRDECSLLDKVGMEIDERAYFVEAEQPEADLEAEIKRFFDECIVVHHIKMYGSDETVIYADSYELIARHFAEWERTRSESELRLAWGKISKDPFDVDSVFKELLEHLKK